MLKKNEIRTFSNTIHKNKLKVDERPKCKAIHYKSLRGKHRKNTFDINFSSFFFIFYFVLNFFFYIGV